ncbi:MAG: hypothetical protein JWO20_2055 [Candidatus Angelobacter sp.]|jgi:hypothetical protein|nr:hypothetical protein [Candidatus Angelobacter sp.]
MDKARLWKIAAKVLPMLLHSLGGIGRVTKLLRHVFFGLAGLCFVSSLLIHLASWLVVLPMNFGFALPLHLGIFVTVGALYLMSRIDRVTIPMTEIYTAGLPEWTTRVIQIGFAYLFLNFLLFFIGSQGYSNEHRGDEFFVVNHGKIIREISEQEYKTRETAVTGFFAAGWMCAYLPVLFYFAPRKMEE